jgi:2-haloacid dehalogenase
VQPRPDDHRPLDLSAFDALSFDCYGTLIDWEAGIRSHLGAWALRHEVAATGDALIEAFGAAETQVELDDPALLYPQVLARTLRSIASRYEASVSEEEAEAFGASVPEWPAFPDSPDALAALGERYRLIILSNVDRASFAGSNRRLGVTFDAVVTAQDVGSYKPDARNFDALLAKAAEMGVRPGRLLHVAQSLYHDHVPAKRAGLPTVWVDRRRGHDGWGATPPPQGDVVPDLVVGSMAELAELCAGVPLRR